MIEAVIKELPNAYRWLCARRQQTKPGHDVWDLRFHWNSLQPLLEQQLRNGTFLLSPLRRYPIDGESIDCWCSIDSLVLKAIALCMAQCFAPAISKRCKHVKGRGGAQRAVSTVRQALSSGSFHHVLRMDVQSYYASIDHEVLLNQLRTRIKDERIIGIVRQMCERVVCHDGYYHSVVKKSIPRGCPLSPLLGAIYLSPMDRAIEAVMKKHHLFYVRFMDDWLVLAPGQRILRKVIRIIYRVLAQLKLGLHPDKKFIGRVTHGFDFLGYWMQPDYCRVSPVSIRRCLAKTYQLLEQKADGDRLSTYWKHWRAWAHTQFLNPDGVVFVNAWLYKGWCAIRIWYHTLLDERLVTSIL